ncbi:hypothetical protein NG819_10325 [Pseudarthrobacter sp. Fe7]|nr:hypothetical protein NG819_10325 [Pseudarthrobacter sp. Fe7]
MSLGEQGRDLGDSTLQPGIQRLRRLPFRWLRDGCRNPSAAVSASRLRIGMASSASPAGRSERYVMVSPAAR